VAASNTIIAVLIESINKSPTAASLQAHRDFSFEKTETDGRQLELASRLISLRLSLDRCALCRGSAIAMRRLMAQHENAVNFLTASVSLRDAGIS
jgi:hypothetical protein